jgi:putative tricarboxylic transport membrane protein
MHKTIANLILAAACTVTLAASQAQTTVWKPEKNVEIVVPAAAGGGTDRMARTIQKIVQDRRIVESTTSVVNKPGGGGTVGYTYVMQHRGDGHYVVVTYPSLLTNHIIGVSQINHTNFTPLAQFGNEYIGLAVKADSPIKTNKDLLDRLRKDPGSVVFGTFALGAPTHIALALVMKAAGVDVRKLKVVVFASSGESMAALYGGHVDMVPSAVANLVAPVQEGRVRVIGVTSPKRMQGALAQVPTWRESGIDVVTGYWRGVVGPPGMPAAQIAFWDDVFARLVKTEEWKKELDRSAAENEYINSRESKQFLDTQYEELKRILTDLGLAKQI